jgi:glycosyltransferase involved in cell wall biosynthesis
VVNSTLPLISVITPSFNQGKFIRETIESVLTQDYPHIEHIVIDGRSTDGTLQILKEYEKRDTRFHFVSEPDMGQSHAINKGLKMARGSIIGWLNSDDTYLPTAAKKAVEAFRKHPEWSMVYGNAYLTDEENKVIRPIFVKPFDAMKLFHTCFICQPAAFMKKNVLNEIGGVDESLHFCMDYDLWIRIANNKYPIGSVKDFFANARYHSSSKTATRLVDIGFPEIIKTSIKNYGTVSNEWLNHFLEHYYNKGLFWYLNLFKSYSIFGDSPKISQSNVYKDSWAPPHLRISIEANPEKSLHTLIIKGTQEQFLRVVFEVSLNGSWIQRTKVDKGPFTLEIPVLPEQPISVLEIVSNRSFIPDQLLNNSDQRTLSYKITDILPLSKEEYQFTKEFQKGSRNVVRWVNNNLKPNPDLS